MNLVGEGKKFRHKVAMKASIEVLFMKIVIDKIVVNKPDLKWWC